MDKSSNILNRHVSISSPSLSSQLESYSSDIPSSSNDMGLDKSPVLSPVFKSEAARQIIIEMSGKICFLYCIVQRDKYLCN